MSDFLEKINLMLGISDVSFCLLLTVFAFFLTLLLSKWIINYFPFHEIEQSGEGVGAYCNVIGILYAIILGYVLVSVYESYTTAESAVEKEATLVIDLFRDAEGLPLKYNLAMRKTLYDYVKSVTENEWDYMVDKRTYHPETFDIFANLYHIARSIKCETDEQRLFLGEMIVRLNDLSTIRHERVVAANSRVPNMLWGLMTGVGVVTFSLSFLFPVESNLIRVYLLSCTAAVMTFTTLLIYVLDRPYSGSLGIQPESMNNMLKIVDEKVIGKEMFKEFRESQTKDKLEAIKGIMKKQDSEK